MKSAAYLYGLVNSGTLVRRDLPIGSPTPSLAVPTDDHEQQSFQARAAAGAWAFGFREAITPQPRQPSLISSSEGRITSLLLTIPSGTTTGDFAAIYNALLETLPRTTQLVCLVNSGSKASVEAWLAAHDRTATSTVVEAPEHLGFSLWAQDAYAVSIDSAGDAYFMEPLSFLRYADAVVSDYVSTATALQNFQTPLYFQGGNILIGDTFWFIGVDYPTNTLQYVSNAIFPNPGETPQQLVRRLYSEYLDQARTLHYVGSSVPVPSETVVLVQEDGTYFVDIVFQGNRPGTAQPLFHIDMFLTLVGRGPDGRFRVLVGAPSLAPPPSSKNWRVYAMENVYDSIATTLSALGFDVIRNPLPLTFNSRTIPVASLNQPADPELHAIYQELTRAGAATVELRSWYFATANNALVQNDPASKRVWLPSYGHGTYRYLEVSDAANMRLWSALGYDVTMLPSCHQLARGLGAVHCIQKYLGRS